MRLAELFLVAATATGAWATGSRASLSDALSSSRARLGACAVEGDFDKGRRIMSAMLPLMAVLEQGGKFIQCVKHGVETTGLRAGPMRPPLKGLNKDEKRGLEQVIRVLKTTVTSITEGN